MGSRCPTCGQTLQRINANAVTNLLRVRIIPTDYEKKEYIGKDIDFIKTAEQFEVFKMIG